MPGLKYQRPNALSLEQVQHHTVSGTLAKTWSSKRSIGAGTVYTWWSLVECVPADWRPLVTGFRHMGVACSLFFNRSTRSALRTSHAWGMRPVPCADHQQARHSFQAVNMSLSLQISRVSFACGDDPRAEAFLSSVRRFTVKFQESSAGATCGPSIHAGSFVPACAAAGDCVAFGVYCKGRTLMNILQLIGTPLQLLTRLMLAGA